MNDRILKAGERPRKRAVPIGICAVLASVGMYFSFRSGVRISGAGPLLFLVACPLMHFFMHGGHGGRTPGPDRDPKDEDRLQ